MGRHLQLHFFTSANNLQAVGEKIHFGKDKPFDEKYAPLYSRDIEYQKFWYMMKRYIPEFTNLFTEVSDYLEKVLSCYLIQIEMRYKI